MTKLRLPYINEYRDRYGKLRRYVRRPGCRSVPLPGLPGSAEFMEAYQAAMGGPAPKRTSRRAPGSLGALILDYFASTEFANLAPGSQALYRKALGPVAEKDGHRMVRDMPREAGRKIIAEIGARSPGMANVTAAAGRAVMRLAIAQGQRNDNPFAGIPKYRLGTHHTWTEDELAAYEARWPLGTRQRLAYDLLLWTLQRLGDVARMSRSDIRDNAIHGVQQKTGTPFAVPVHPQLAASLRECPARGLSLIGDESGRPYTPHGLGMMVARAIADAGLPDRCVAHGLRKAGMRRLAEHGASTKHLQAMSGHRTLAEVERYTSAADQARLARDAMAKLPNRTGS